MTDTNGMGYNMNVVPQGYSNGYGNDGGMFGGNWMWFLLVWMAMFGWGNGGFGFGGNQGGGGYAGNEVQRGFDHQAVMTGISGVQNAVNGIVPAVQNGFAQAEIAANARQMADMQQNFGVQTTMLQGFNGMQSQFAQCCCDNRLAVCQTQNLISNEAAATRAAMQAGFQNVLDTMCADKIDAKNEKIAELQTQVTVLNNNNYLQNALTAQTQYFLGLYPPTAAAAAKTTAA